MFTDRSRDLSQKNRPVAHISVAIDKVKFNVVISKLPQTDLIDTGRAAVISFTFFGGRCQHYLTSFEYENMKNTILEKNFSQLAKKMKALFFENYPRVTVLNAQMFHEEKEKNEVNTLMMERLYVSPLPSFDDILQPLSPPSDLKK